MLTVQDLVAYSIRQNYRLSNVTIFKIMRESDIATTKRRTANGVHQFLWPEEAKSCIDSYITRKMEKKIHPRRCLRCGALLADQHKIYCPDCHARQVVRRFCGTGPLCGEIDYTRLLSLKQSVEELLKNKKFL